MYSASLRVSKHANPEVIRKACGLVKDGLIDNLKRMGFSENDFRFVSKYFSGEQSKVMVQALKIRRKKSQDQPVRLSKSRVQKASKMDKPFKVK